MECARRLASATLQANPFNEVSTTVMGFTDQYYLCTADHRQCADLFSSKLALAPHYKTVVWVDISQSMVDLYNRRAYNQSTPSDEIRAVCVSGITYCSPQT
ncbi:hypothetical protein ID866_5568 [Astraeus odoratus]|nr:hypothetical protein ID866_5568 [Astraeus odoratus]